jgi:mannose-6-phosphate isomerase-like protein (cupin superfamily)
MRHAGTTLELQTDYKKLTLTILKTPIKKQMNSNQICTKRTFKEISDKVGSAYENFILESVNDHCLRIAVFQGEYKWHYHQNMDELFVVLEGELKIELKENLPVFLKPGDFIKIPAKTIHRTSAAVRTVNLCFEKNMDDTIFVD